MVSLTYGGWDHHNNIQTGFENQAPALDQAFSMLVRDLDNRGLLDTTLVLLTTEFGRTPKINTTDGRDHWPKVFSIALAGGGIKRGYVHGKSNAQARSRRRTRWESNSLPPPSINSSASTREEAARTRRSSDRHRSQRLGGTGTPRMSLLASVLWTAALGSSPELGQILPRGAQVGSEVDVTLYGRRLGRRARDHVARPWNRGDVVGGRHRSPRQGTSSHRRRLPLWVNTS